MEPVRLGLIGLGVMGADHLEEEYDVVSEIRFTALCDTNVAVLESRGRQYSLPTFADHRALLASGLCDAVLIATPHPYHAPVAIDAARHGLHVLVEKPIAVTASEADTMLAAACQAGVLLGVMFNERTQPVYRTARRLLAEGMVGSLHRSVLIASHWFRSQRYYDSGAWRGTWRGEGGGVTMNQAAHALDLLVWLCGLPRGVTAHAAAHGHAIEVEDTVDALLDFGSDHAGYLFTSTAQYPGQMRLELSGEHGQLVVEDESLRFFRLKRPLSASRRDTPVGEKPTGDWEEVPLDEDDDDQDSRHAAVVRRFARAVRLGTPLVADGADGVRALELANALLLSGFTRTAVSLPLDRPDYDAFLAAQRAQARR